MFNSRNQRAGESAESFIRTLYEMAEKCDFGPNRDSHIRDRIVIGLLDKELSRDLQLKPDLDLATATQLVHQSETVRSQMAEQASASNLDEVRRKSVNSRGDSHKSRNASQRHNRGAHEEERCTRCNYKHRGRECPAKGQQCHRCNRKDHFQACCETKVVREIDTGTNVKNDTDEVYYLGEIDVKDYAEVWWVKLPINGETFNFKIDPGADVTVINKATYDLLRTKPTLEPARANLAGVGAAISCYVTFKCNISHKGREYCTTAYVVDCLNNLLGRNAVCAMDLVKLNICETVRDRGIIKGPDTHIMLRDDEYRYL